MSKLSTVIAATLLIAAGAASAQAADAPLTREAVVAELAAARNSGELAAIQGEKGIEVTTPASAKAAALATTKLPRQAVLTVKPTEVRSDEKLKERVEFIHRQNQTHAIAEEYVDAQVGRLRAELERLGLSRRTLGAVVADHGENAARELGDFPAPIARRASALASR